MQDCVFGRYNLREAVSVEDLTAAQQLRGLVFREGRDDRDQFDSRCKHILIEDRASGQVVCCFRLLVLQGGEDIQNSYSAQYYELSSLRGIEGPMIELGRFCVHPGCSDPDILRAAWGALTKYVDEIDAQLLFGCSSFAGIEEADYLDAFSLLRERHLAPKRWLPRVKAPRVFPFASKLRLRRPNLKAAMRAMPPLLRTYLMMGGWVSDHAVIDRDLNTLHVFTGLEVRAIPPARARVLRAVVPQAQAGS